MDKSLEERINLLEKKVAALEGQVQAQPKKFIPEDSNGVCKDTRPCECPKKEVTPEVPAQEQPITITCPNCYTDIKISKMCPKCKIAYSEECNYCSECGTRLKSII